MFWWLLLIVSLLIGFIIRWNNSNHYWKRKNVLSVKPIPLIGNMLPFIMRQMAVNEWVEWIYNQYDDAKYYGIYQFNKPSLLIRDTDLIKKVMIKDFNHFVDHNMFFTETRERIFSKNLFSLTGQEWRDMRVTLSPTFTGSKMRSMFILVKKCADQFVDHFLAMAQPNQPITSEMKQLCTAYTNDIIASCIFGYECNSLKDRNNEFYKRVQAVSHFDGIRNIIFLGYFSFPKLMRFLKVRVYSDDEIDYFKNIVMDTIELREKNNIIRPDMIHLLMEARKGRLFHESSYNDDAGFATVKESDNTSKTENKTNRAKLTDDIVTAQVFIFVLASFETVGTALSFIAYELAANPDIQQKLQEEIDQACDECNGNITYEQLMKLKYLDAVISETLRKWPPVPMIDRLCVQSYKLETEGCEPLIIEKGETVHIPAYAIQRDSKYYPDPDRFDPERFCNENKSNINPATFLPFGSGPRSCIGNRMALTVIKTFYFQLLRKFDIVVVEKSVIPLKPTRGKLMNAAESGLWFGYKLRNK